jgi:hypothetical protein
MAPLCVPKAPLHPTSYILNPGFVLKIGGGGAVCKVPDTIPKKSKSGLGTPSNARQGLKRALYA